MDLIILLFNTIDLITTYLLERRVENRGTLHFRKIKIIVPSSEKIDQITRTILVFYSIDISRSSSRSYVYAMNNKRSN